MQNTSVENSKTSMDRQLLPTGKCGHSPRCARFKYFRSLLTPPRLVDQLPFHALSISSSVPKHMWGVLDVVPLIT